MEARHQKLKDKRVIFIWIGIIVAIIISFELSKADAKPTMPFVKSEKFETLEQTKNEISGVVSGFASDTKISFTNKLITLITNKGINLH